MEVEAKWAVWALAFYVAFLLLASGLLYTAARSLEAAEAFKSKVDTVYTECAKDLEADSDRLGPKPLKHPGLTQDGEFGVLYYVIQAEGLSRRFKAEVVAVLAAAADPASGAAVAIVSLKSREVSARMSESARRSG